MNLTNEQIIEELVLRKDLPNDVVSTLMERLFAQEIPNAQAAAILLLWRAKGESGGELLAASQEILRRAKPFHRPKGVIGDIVGTGGDGKNTINISTMASFVAASAGLSVAKHGNVLVSSKCGSADLLKALSINYDDEAKNPEECLAKLGWAFIFAPHYHPAFLAVKPLRQELKTKAVFNILGPLVNPARPDYLVLGVYDAKYLRPIAETLQRQKVKKALVVRGSGLDEIAVHGETECVLVDGDIITPFSITPFDMGLPECPLDDLIGQGPNENAATFLRVLNGEGKKAEDAAVCASAGALLWLSNHAQSLKDGVSVAMEHLKTKKAMKLFNEIRGYYANS